MPLAIQPPVETEIWRRGPYTKLDDVAALYRAASAAGGAIVSDHRD
ncbi:hypothetical protein [Fulvimarina endophytica]|nr:hypothetical protein [Fulvimarina endophytica]